MPRFEIYLALDVSITTESAQFTIEAESREAARAIAEEVMAHDYEAATYPTGTVEGGTPGAEIEWRISTYDPCTAADIDVSVEVTTVGETPAGWREIEGGPTDAE